MRRIYTAFTMPQLSIGRIAYHHVVYPQGVQRLRLGVITGYNIDRGGQIVVANAALRHIRHVGLYFDACNVLWMKQSGHQQRQNAGTCAEVQNTVLFFCSGKMGQQHGVRAKTKRIRML